MVPEAPLERDEIGLAPAGPGWFVLNARDARWRHHEGRGDSLPFTGVTDYEAETWFPQLGVALRIIGPGEPIGIYHREADQEGFLILAGEALLLIEGEERPLRQWDFVHCPAQTEHMIIGAGNGPCILISMGSRQFMGGADSGWGAYTVAEIALLHGVGVEEETADAEIAYARFPPTELTPYRDGLLPG